MFEFWIDGTKYPDPLNWKDFTETIEYDDELNVFLFKYENKLTFSGDLFSYFYDRRNAGGMCGFSDIVIKKKCDKGIPTTIFSGKIFIADCLFYVNKCLVECSIVDDSYAAFLFNNKNIKVPLLGQASDFVYTKNGELIYPTFLNTVTGNYRQVPNLFNTASGAVIPGVDVSIFFIHDLFHYLVIWLTDGNCSFKSDYLNWTLPITKESEKVRNLTVTLGYNIRVYGQNLQTTTLITFDELFKEVNRLYPLVLSVEYEPSGKPIIRIEDADSMRSSISSVEIDNIADLREKSDNALLYGTIRVGSPNVTFDPLQHTYPTDLKDIAFKEEIMYLNGYCNTSTQKDLFGNFVCDSNVIEELIGNISTYDSNLIFLEVDPTSVTFGGIYDAIKTLNVDGTAWHYNDNLLNINVIKRNHFHENISNVSGDGVDLMNISPTASSIVNLGNLENCAAGVAPPAQSTGYSALNFTIDNAAVFSGLKYTALISGNYTFQYHLSYQSSLYSTGTCTASSMNMKFYVTTIVDRYNSLNVLQESQTFSDIERSAVGIFDYEFDCNFIMTAGDYIKARTNYTCEPIDFTQDSGINIKMFYGVPVYGRFETLSTPNNAGVNATNSGLNYVSNIINFSKPLSEDKYQLIKSNITYLIRYNTGESTNKAGWIKRISRTLATSEMEWELISNIANSK